MIDRECLVCGHPSPSESAHWPRTRKFSEATVPLCRLCHTAQHSGDHDVIERLIVRAPVYWQREGLWEMYGPEYETWHSRREYLEAVTR